MSGSALRVYCEECHGEGLCPACIGTGRTVGCGRCDNGKGPECEGYGHIDIDPDDYSVERIYDGLTPG